eukprot:TRINITY_DN31193_c0_g1_i1.p1 TRINITY_DN31193_c0_g1~~TRINITY_DN31193_c0_g1_i1.p1  ORF type:complete len:263 (-),score=66.95 TRINITY_DN31193_c0_g1_i1:13-801(-)
MASLWRRFLINSTANRASDLLENAYQLTFNRGVSKTPKGKKNLLVPKKKNVLGGKAKKKSKGEKEPEDLGVDETKRFQALLMTFLDASVPKRYRGEKDRKRQMEREKLGLVSKQRQREIEIEKELERKAKDIILTEEDDQGEMEGEPIPQFQLTVDNGIRLAKCYSRLMMQDLRQRQKELNTRLRLKHDAILALPAPLREAALVPDISPFPAFQLRGLELPGEEHDQKSNKTRDKQSKRPLDKQGKPLGQKFKKSNDQKSKK